MRWHAFCFPYDDKRGRTTGCDLADELLDIETVGLILSEGMDAPIVSGPQQGPTLGPLRTRLEQAIRARSIGASRGFGSIPCEPVQEEHTV